MGQVIRGGEQFETHIEADHRGQLVQQGPDSGALDAFGRQRFSQPFTLFDSMLRFTKRTDLWDEAVLSDILILTLQCSSSEEATGLLGWRELV